MLGLVGQTLGFSKDGIFSGEPRIPALRRVYRKRPTCPTPPTHTSQAPTVYSNCSVGPLSLSLSLLLHLLYLLCGYFFMQVTLACKIRPKKHEFLIFLWLILCNYIKKIFSKFRKTSTAVQPHCPKNNLNLCN